jgi:Mrp family chromosome partitioning ATPase
MPERLNPPGRIITFYSYKGGTGRSMAMANVAWLLALSGARVLAIDWDLEAPGLHRYFRPFLDDPDLAESEGLVGVAPLGETNS